MEGSGWIVVGQRGGRRGIGTFLLSCGFGLFFLVFLLLLDFFSHLVVLISFLVSFVEVMSRVHRYIRADNTQIFKYVIQCHVWTFGYILQPLIQSTGHLEAQRFRPPTLQSGSDCASSGFVSKATPVEAWHRIRLMSRNTLNYDFQRRVSIDQISLNTSHGATP